MQLIFLLALVLAFSSLLSADGQPVSEPEVKLTCATLACGALAAYAWWIGQLKCHLAPVLGDSSFRWIGVAERLHKFAYLAVMLIVFLACDWAQLVHVNWRLGRFLLADDVAVVLPVVIPLIISWLLLATPTSTPDAWEANLKRLRSVGLQVRHLIVLPLIPIFVTTGIADVQRISSHVPGENATHGFSGLLAVIAVAIMLPCLFRLCWRTQPLEAGPTRSLIEHTLAEAGVSVRQILRWETHGQLANAAVTGFMPRMRYLFVTEELLRRLSPWELQAITAHEAAHCRLGHLPRLAASLAIPFFALLLSDPILSALRLSTTVSPPLLVLAVLGLWALWHGRWARLLEHQADWAACRLMSGGQTPLSLEAVEGFERALRATGTGSSGDWLHPSLAERIGLLQRLARQPESETAFQRRLRWTACGQWLLIGLLAGAWLCSV